eukprot:3880050-Pyramimonas_sp.AAC.1
MGHKSRYGMTGCVVCREGIIYEASMISGDKTKPAIDWIAAGLRRDPGNPGPCHARNDGRAMSRAA